MIKFNNLHQDKPYSVFKEKYIEASEAGQKNIEAIAISSYNKDSKEVDSRFVNLKIIDGNKFIFFSNYNSPKSVAFNSFEQISALFYWSSVNVQIKMKAKIQKTSSKYNQEYFEKRSLDKNALAISSNQSQEINSYDRVLLEYNDVKNNQDLTICPDYWGGFSFTPYYFEFWQGHDFRLNKRTAYINFHDEWKKILLQP